VRKFHDLASLSPTARRAETAPAERVLRAVLQSPAFRVRSGDATSDIGRFLDERGILVLDGSSRGNLSRDAMSVMMGAIILRVIRHARTGAANRIVLVIVEAVNANLLGLHESQALAEADKWGLEVHILVQDPFGFPTAEVRSNVLQNCGRHEWFRQGSADAARLAAEDAATRSAQGASHRVSDTHRRCRLRPRDDGLPQRVGRFDRSHGAGHESAHGPLAATDGRDGGAGPLHRTGRPGHPHAEGVDAARTGLPVCAR
jgi:hypothetical protein